jgi:hypothetical protein
VYITWLRLIKNLTPREEKSELSPEKSNKKLAKIVDVPRMF